MGVSRFDIIEANGFNGPVLSPGARVFYVNNATSGLPVGAVGGSNGNSGDSPLKPFSTLAYAISQCSSGRGDMIYVMPGHSETVTAPITIDKNNVQIIGAKTGNNRPTFTINGAVDLINVSASGVYMASLKLTIITTDEATALLNVSGANCHFFDLQMIPSTAGSINVVDCITLASGANDCILEKIDIRNTLTAVNSFLSIEAAVARLTVRDCFFFGDCVTAGVIDGAAATQLRLENNTIGTIGTTIPAAILDSNPTGVVDNNRFLGTHTTIASNAQLGNAVRQARSYVLEQTDNSAQATDVIPVKDVE